MNTLFITTISSSFSNTLFVGATSPFLLGSYVFIAITLCALLAAGIKRAQKPRQTNVIVDASIPRVNITSPAFDELGVIPEKHTGRGEDTSPALLLPELASAAVSIAIIMDDLDVPWKANLNHWVIWNIPATTSIPESISHGETLPELGGAIQGIGYGTNRYRGPLPLFGTHRYQFHVFVLDSTLSLASSSKKNELLSAMKGHILQYGTLTGWYPKARR